LGGWYAGGGGVRVELTKLADPPVRRDTQSEAFIIYIINAKNIYIFSFAKHRW
jgi:hypothetical protein